MFEEWRPVVGYEKLYEVSSIGGVRSLDRMVRTKSGSLTSRMGMPLKRMIDASGSGYAFVNLSKDGQVRKSSVHVLVLEAFKGQRPSPSHQACHGDGDRTNPALSNLRWDTVVSNAADRIAHGTQARGETSGVAKLTKQDIDLIRSSNKSSLKLAKELGVAGSTIRAVRIGQNWSHL